jgi:hypothetical protein
MLAGYCKRIRFCRARMRITRKVDENQEELRVSCRGKRDWTDHGEMILSANFLAMPLDLLRCLVLGEAGIIRRGAGLTLPRRLLPLVSQE